MLYWQAALEGKSEKNSSFGYSSTEILKASLYIHPEEVSKWNLFKSLFQISSIYLGIKLLKLLHKVG